MEYIVIAFESTHSAMECKKYLGEKFKLTVMPTLRAISSACGISLRLDIGDMGAIKKALADGGFEQAQYNIYVVDKDGRAELSK